MARPYDAATKDLIESDPANLLRYLGLSVTGTVIVQNPDLTTVVAESDRIMLVEEDPPWLVHVEVQSSAETDLDLRIDRYNLMIEYRERMPVISAVLLLRPQADSPKLTGCRVRKTTNGEIYREFRYHVVRAWDQSAESILQGPPALLPLTTLASIPNDQIRDMVEKIEARLSELPDTNLANRLRTNAQILMGLRYSAELIENCPWRTDKMRESTVYQKILKEGREEGREEGRAIGREEGAIEVLEEVASERFGSPSSKIVERLAELHDLKKIASLTARVAHVSSWDELLQE